MKIKQNSKRDGNGYVSKLKAMSERKEKLREEGARTKLARKRKCGKRDKQEK